VIDEKVAQRMHTGGPTVSPEADIGELARLLSDERLSSVPVVDDGKLVGMVGQADLVFQEVEDDVDLPHTLPFFGGVIFLERMDKWRDRFRRAYGTSVADLMTSETVTVTAEDTVHDAAQKMVDHNINRLPVVDETGAVAGVISRADIVAALAEEW